MLNASGLPITEIFRADLQSDDLLEQSEFTDEFLSIPYLDAIYANRFFSKFRPMDLDSRLAHISPVSPPPKHA